MDKTLSGDVQITVVPVLQLTSLGPDIVETILDGRHRSDVTLARLLDPFPVDWMAQRRDFGLPWQETQASDHRCST